MSETITTPDVQSPEELAIAIREDMSGHVHGDVDLGYNSVSYVVVAFLDADDNASVVSDVYTLLDGAGYDVDIHQQDPPSASVVVEGEATVDL